MMSGAKRVKVQEKRVAEDLGGRRQPGSGNQWHAKGDVKSPEFLIECKQTDKLSYRLERAVLDKIETEAILAGKQALLQVEFHTPKGVDSYVVMSYDLFLQLAREKGE